MVMFRYVCVGCDECGAPASGVVDTGPQARALVPADWVRTTDPWGSMIDLCPGCAAEAATTG